MTSNRSIGRWACMGMMVLWSAGAVRAQEKADLSADRIVGNRMAQLALFALGGGEAPSDAQLRLARTMLEQAASIDDEAAEVLRLYLEAARLGGSDEQRRAALKKYLRLSPSDDVAQLELVDLVVGDLNTATERSEKYVALLNSRLGAAMRSRIAWRAALLERERGEEEQYRSFLKTAVALDEVHRAPVEAAYRLIVADEKSTRLERAQALLVLHGAAPTDPSVHVEIARLLMECGAPSVATSWFESGALLWLYRGAPGPEAVTRLYRDWALALWGSGRPEEALELIRSLDGEPAEGGGGGGGAGEDEGGAEGGDDAEKADAAVDAGGADAAAGPRRASSLPPALRWVVAAIESSRTQPVEAQRAFDDLVGALTKRLEERPNDAGRLIERITAHLLFDRNVDETTALLERLEKQVGAEHAALRRLKGWRLLRDGKVDAARAALEPLATSDAVAQYGLALTHTDQAGLAQRVELLKATYAAAPGGLIGEMAAAQLRRLGERAQLDGDRATVVRVVSSVPEELRRMAEDPRRYLAMQLRPSEARYGYAEPIEVEIKLTNVSNMPMTMGESATVPTRLLLLSRVSIGSGDWVDVPAKIVDMGRRLRLDPGESVTVTTRLDLGGLGDVLALEPVMVTRISVTGLLNPRLTRSGGFVPGLMGAAASSRRIERVGMSVNERNLEMQLQALRGADAGKAVAAAAWLTRVIVTLPEDQADLARRLAGELNDALRRFTPRRRAAALSFASEPGRATTLLSGALDMAIRDEDPVVHYLLLASIGAELDSPLLTAALRRDLADPVRVFAEDLRFVLESMQKKAEATEAQK